MKKVFMLLLAACTAFICIGVAISQEDIPSRIPSQDGSSGEWVAEQLSPVYYYELEDEIGIRPMKAVRFIGDEGYFDALEFSTEEEAREAGARIVSLERNENVVEVIEVSGKSVVWIVGSETSGLVYNEGALLITVPVAATEETVVRGIAEKVLESDTLDYVNADLGDAYIILPPSTSIEDEAAEETFGGQDHTKGVQMTHAPSYSVEDQIPQANTYFSLESYNYPGYYIRHANSLGELTEIFSDQDGKDATFMMVAGLANSTTVSFESVNYPGHYLRHQYQRLRIDPASSEQLLKEDATFRVVPGLADPSAVSFQSYNYPDRYIRHRDYHLYVETGDGDLFRRDATFWIRSSQYQEEVKS